jgi:hypothetical protein
VIIDFSVELQIGILGMDTPLLVISVLGIMLVLLLRIGDLVGAVAFGVVVLVIGWAYQSTRRKRLGEKQENRH